MYMGFVKTQAETYSVPPEVSLPTLISTLAFTKGHCAYETVCVCVYVCLYVDV